MHVTVCIVGFRNAVDIVHCLQTLERSTYKAFDLVICENGGEQALQELKARIPQSLASGRPVSLIAAPTNPGYAGGVNLCIRHRPDSDAWWVLNPDTEADPGALEAMVGRLEKGDCQAVGCTTYDRDRIVESRGGYWRSWLARAVAIDMGRAVADKADDVAIERQLDYLSGASMLVGKAFVNTVGLMREDYFLYGEEVEWCLRSRAAGFKLGIASAARVLHKQGTTTGSVADFRARSRTSVFLDERNKILITRDLQSARLPVTALATLALLLLRYARRGAWRQTGYALAGWYAGLRNRRGKPLWLIETPPHAVARR